MKTLNTSVLKNGMGQVLVTFFILNLDLSSGQCTYINSGHRIPFLRRLSKGGVKPLAGRPSPILGLEEDPCIVLALIAPMHDIRYLSLRRLTRKVFT
jgi:serine phosphatase RsbU (regulator of sigma subunit)